MHRQVRRALVTAIATQDLGGIGLAWREIAAQALARHAERNDSDRSAEAAAFKACLSEVATAMLMRAFFGTGPGDVGYDALVAAYARLGPHGLAWTIGPAQHAAFAELSALLAAAPARGLLGTLAAQGQADATMIGNLIYMVEMGRYDIAGFLRWIAWHAACQPGWMARLNAEPTLDEAFAREVLRLDQSERLVRRARAEFVFEGWLFLRDASLRLCLWEAHRSAAAFDKPERFDPGRFIGSEPAADAYSPFGLDRHNCPLAGWSIAIGAAFACALAQLKLHLTGDGAPVRGAYHWEPSPHFGLALDRRTVLTEASTVAARFLALAQAQPSAPAILGPLATDRVTSYAELARRTRAIAAMLKSCALQPEAPVGVALPRDAGLVAALLACGLAGAAHVAVEPEEPARRTQRCCNRRAARSCWPRARSAVRSRRHGRQVRRRAGNHWPAFWFAAKRLARNYVAEPYAAAVLLVLTGADDGHSTWPRLAGEKALVRHLDTPRESMFDDPARQTWLAWLGEALNGGRCDPLQGSPGASSERAPA